jgi:NAD-dependent SIR2 family protein deacetylase
MKIGGIQLPKPLLNATKEGKFAIFAGAGVSMPSPSNYPNFRDLASRVAAGKLTLGPEEPIDQFFGRLAETKVQVHQLVSRMLNDPASQPNSLHLDLLRLFEKPESVRLVTTNFDSHFVSGAATVFPAQGSCELHFAPALPLGHSFSGIVALHGSVSRPFERLVLTDSDFGRAYLTEGWARIFLQRLCETYTVLFVGYTFDR